MFHGFFAFDHAGGLDGAPVEQQFFGQGGFPSVGMGYDGERAPFFNFVDKTLQTKAPPSSG